MGGCEDNNVGDGAIAANVKQYFNQIGPKTYFAVAVDLTGFESYAAANDVIATADNTADAAYIAVVPKNFGRLTHASILCTETPATGEVDIDFNVVSDADKVGDASVGTNGIKLAAGGDWTANMVTNITFTGTADVADVQGGEQYVYLSVGTSSTPTAGTYTAGKMILLLEGISLELEQLIPDA